MKPVFLFGVLLGLLSLQEIRSQPIPPVSNQITLDLGSSVVMAEFPEDVTDLKATPTQHPIYFQGTKGDPTQGYDTYVLQLVTIDKKKRDRLLDKEGKPQQFTSVGKFMEGVAKKIKGQYTLRPHPTSDLPENLRSGTPEDRYLWLSGTLKGYETESEKPPSAEFLWRILIVDGETIMAYREISPAYIKQNHIDPRDEQEWAFLKSIRTHSRK